MDTTLTMTRQGKRRLPFTPLELAHQQLVAMALTSRKRYFLGGTYLQRPAVSIVNGHVIGAFAGHCELFNYTGMVVSVSTTTGVGVASMFAVVASPGGPDVTEDWTIPGGESSFASFFASITASDSS